MSKRKRPKVDGGEKSVQANADTRYAAEQFLKVVKKFRAQFGNTTNLRLLVQKSLRDLMLAIELSEGELQFMRAKIHQYQDFRNQQGRKGRGKKKHADDEPDEKELKENDIKKEVEKMKASGVQLEMFDG